MKRAALTFALAAALTASGASPSLALTQIDGFSNGAFFRIAVPDATDPVPWNGTLVIWNHGFDISPISPVSFPTGLGPLLDVQLQEGYAVAASSYRQNGWALFKTNNDLRDLVGIFKVNFGQPDEIIVTGGSLGGIVTAAALEKGNLGNVTGALPICGAVAGSRNWDGGTDLRLVYDAVCSGVPGAAIPGGAAGLPDIPPNFNFPVFPDLLLALNACFGIPFGSPDPNAPLRLAQFVTSTQLPVNFVITDMAFATNNGLADLVHQPDKLDGRIGVSTAGVVYPDPFTEANIARVSANPGAEVRLDKNYTPNGNVGATKIVSLHTDGDGLVIVENESEYASVVPAGNLTTAIVDEAGNSHCGFTPAETIASWESLRTWVGGAPQPSAADVQAICNVVAANPLTPGPCRIDPAYVVPDMDGRVPPR